MKPATSIKFGGVEAAIALVLFYLPWAHFPQARAIRVGLLHAPTWGLGNEGQWSITPFLAPETLLTLMVAVVLLSGRRGSTWTPTMARIALSCGLMILGGALALPVSRFVGISIDNLAADCTVLILALIICLARPNPSTVRIWSYGAMAGTTVMCLAALYYFWAAFGIPHDLSTLPVLRVSAGIAEYQRATYGLAGNTADLLVMTTPVAVGMLLVETSWVGRGLLLVAAASMLTNLLISFQRWAWVCVGVSVLLLIVYHRRSRSGWILAAALLAAAALVGPTVSGQLGGYFADAADPGSGSNLFGRLAAWEEGLGVLSSNPGGIGLGMAGTDLALSQTSSHNLFIDIGVEGGVLALIGSITWALFHVKLAVASLLRPEPEDGVAFALLVGAGAFVAFGIFFNSLLSFGGLMVWLGYWFCFPAIAASALDAKSSRSAASGPGRMSLNA